jgi:pimeloyl-ACP methyl ester carboxylesterase
MVVVAAGPVSVAAAGRGWRADEPKQGEVVTKHSVMCGDIRLHVVEQGDGPLVLLIHGFPETSYSWRHQLPALATAGYRAVAFDVRGYGRSSKPANVEAYRMVELVGDAVGLVHALGATTAPVVGHDWGSLIAANAALLQPDTFTAVATLSAPYTPRNGHRPTEIFARAGGDAEFYMSYFQQPGRAEAEIEPDVRGWLRGCYASLSGDTMAPEEGARLFYIPRGSRMRDRFVAGELPAWLSDDDLDVFVEEFERTGFTGALNRYRNVDLDWEDLAAYDGAAITQPSLFIGGAIDASGSWIQKVIDSFPTTMPGMIGSHVLAGCGHWVQQERPALVNQILIDWLHEVSDAA